MPIKKSITASVSRRWLVAGRNIFLNQQWLFSSIPPLSLTIYIACFIASSPFRHGYVSPLPLNVLKCAHAYVSKWGVGLISISRNAHAVISLLVGLLLVRYRNPCLSLFVILQDLHCLQRFYHNIHHWRIKLYYHTRFHI